MAPIRICAVVPTHNHHQALGGIIAALRAEGLAVFVIDDGSAEPAASAIATVHAPDAGVTVHRFASNQGKGVAVTTGFRLAWEAGFTHAVQIDADGQHDTTALPALLEHSRRHPDALISAWPVYDASMPLGRRIGRWITHFWVWLETLSFQIKDSMCGFRVYPLGAVRALLAEHKVGARMDFDTDIMVRLFWRGTDVEMVKVRVIYPPGNISNFRMLADNGRISVMHARLFFGMLARLGGFWRRSRHWSGMPERGAYWGLRLSAFVCHALGRTGCMIVLAPAVLCFVLAGAEQRAASRVFLTRAQGRPASFWAVTRHFFGFAARTVDGFRAWTGRLPSGAVFTDTPDALARLANARRGVVLVVAHFGNVELARALLDAPTRARLTILVHTRHAVNYNRLVREFRPDAALNLIQVTDIGPDTAIDLQQRIECGEWIVIAGDRTPVTGAAHISRVPFFGAEAGFPNGPWILAGLLRCPVHLLFCVRIGRRWRLSLEPFADAIILDRKTRRADLAAYAARYAARLQEMARAFPLQWYNFFDFWAR